jgi:sugar phosphate isomerase/epimerase
MAMKFAFSTVACPKWDLDTILARAKEWAYDGIELRGFLNESVLTASNPFLSDPIKIRGEFAAAGLSICCLASSIAMAQQKKKDAALANDLRMFIDTARELGCPLVKIFDTHVRPGYSRASTGLLFGDWLMPMADYAADRDIVIVIENALSFRSSKELWSIVDRLNHPSVAVCWDIFNAALIGEPPSVSVPTLNNRIQYTQVKDAKLGTLGATYCKLGEGDVPVRNFLTRLRGIGYEGWVTVEWEKAWLPNIAEPEEILPDAITKLRDWTKPLDISDWEAAAVGAGGATPAAKKGH